MKKGSIHLQLFNIQIICGNIMVYVVMVVQLEPPRRVDDGDSQTKKIIVFFFLEFFTASLSQRFLILHLRY